MNPISKYTFLILSILLLAIGFFYNPEWKSKGQTGTLSYDVAGYYMYLPASFIYDDLKKYSFQDTLVSKDINVGIYHGRWQENGGYVFQYPAGMALQYLPFFAIGHAWALNSDKYDAHGFSLPYQASIFFGSLFIAILGLYFLRKSLLEYYDDVPTALCLVALVLGSNYLVYTSVKGAMSHNYLFTINAFLLYLLIQFYKKPGFLLSTLIGLLLGFAILIRPTEAMTSIIALAWGCNLLNRASIFERIQFIGKKWKLFAWALLMVILVGSIQLIYWQHAAGTPIVYSYGEQGFDWKHPHYYLCLFSARCGWLVYSPIMILSLIGFYRFFRQRPEFATSIISYFLVFSYVTFAWSIWWYGGSLGQRALIQAYVFLAFPLTSFFTWLVRQKLSWKIASSVFIIASIYLNFWYSHMAIRGPVEFVPSTVTPKYYKKVIGKWTMEKDLLKFLDTDEEIVGAIKTKNEIYKKDFGDDPLVVQQGKAHYLLHESANLSIKDGWIRTQAKFSCKSKEWKPYLYNQLVVQFLDEKDQVIKNNFIRLERFINPSENTEVFFDTKIPSSSFKKMKVLIYHYDYTHPLYIHHIKLEEVSQ